MATDQEAIRNAYRLALSIDEAGGGDAMNDEIIAILASQLSDPIRTQIIKEVVDEFAPRVSSILESSAAEVPAPLRSYTRRQLRTQFWFYVAALLLAFAVAIPIVRCTSQPGPGAAATPNSGARDGATAARGAAAAAIRGAGVSVRRGAPPTAVIASSPGAGLR